MNPSIMLQRARRPIGRVLTASLSVALVAVLGCAGVTSGGHAGGGTSEATRRHATDSADAARLIAEAAAFMTAYGEELRRGDRAAVAARYSRSGAYELRPGRKRFVTHATLLERYQTRWRPPTSFEWRELSYEVIGPDAIVVAGLFAWGGGVAGMPDAAADAAPVVWSYAALLRREDGVLRLRLEAEAAAPPSR